MNCCELHYIYTGSFALHLTKRYVFLHVFGYYQHQEQVTYGIIHSCRQLVCVCVGHIYFYSSQQTEFSWYDNSTVSFQPKVKGGLLYSSINGLVLKVSIL